MGEFIDVRPARNRLSYEGECITMNDGEPQDLTLHGGGQDPNPLDSTPVAATDERFHGSEDHDEVQSATDSLLEKQPAESYLCVAGASHGGRAQLPDEVPQLGLHDRPRKQPVFVGYGDDYRPPLRTILAPGHLVREAPRAVVTDKGSAVLARRPPRPGQQ